MFNILNLWRRKKPAPQKAPQRPVLTQPRVTPSVSHFSGSTAPASASTVNSSGPDLATMMLYHNLMHHDSARGVETECHRPHIETPRDSYETPSTSSFSSCSDSGSNWGSSSYDSGSSSYDSCSSSSSDW